jgi:uncharacterized protein (DUF1778 family)
MIKKLKQLTNPASGKITTAHVTLKSMSGSKGTTSRHSDGSPKNASEARLKAGTPMSRLEARIPTHLYEMMERAATLRGLTVTSYVAAVVGEDARRTIEQTDIIRLSRENQIAFAKALINPPEPNAKLRAAAKRHAELFGK